jgi:photosystem II stability/assembly factor-like uncharacterized protein
VKLTIQKILLIQVLLLISASSWSEQVNQQSSIWSEPAALAPKSLLLDIINTGIQLVAVGERGHILLSADCGGSWIQSRVETRSTINAVHFVDQNTGWAVGHDSVILKTTDGGKNWYLQFSDIKAEQPLFDIWFSDRMHGLAIGAYGLYMETIDGGVTWIKKQIGIDDFHLYSIAVSVSGHMIIAGESGSLYSSVDKGETWARLESPYHGSYFGALSVADHQFIVFGMRGNIYKSDDDGESWNSIHSNTESTLESGYISPEGTIILVGHNGMQLVSSDNGVSFSSRSSSNRHNYSAITACSSGDMIAVGQSGIERLQQ